MSSLFLLDIYDNRLIRIFDYQLFLVVVACLLNQLGIGRQYALVFYYQDCLNVQVSHLGDPKSGRFSKVDLQDLTRYSQQSIEYFVGKNPVISR